MAAMPRYLCDQSCHALGAPNFKTPGVCFVRFCVSPPALPTRLSALSQARPLRGVLRDSFMMGNEGIRQRQAAQWKTLGAISWEFEPRARNTRCNYLETRASGGAIQRGVGGV